MLKIRGDFNDFIDTIDSPNTAKVAKSMSVIGEHDYSSVTPIDVEQMILGMKPKSPKEITTICYVLSMYAKHIGNKGLLHMAQDVDRKALWTVAKPAAPRKFISNSEFNRVRKEIAKREQYNVLYQQTLFMCLYEDVYNDDMSVIKNVRASDVNGNIVSLRSDDGDVHDIKVTDKLASNLVELGGVSVWERNNRYGTCKIEIKGLHNDSCFKVESRSGSSEYSYRYTYYRILRKISKEYLYFNLLPLQLYVSGIMYRIGIELAKADIGIEDAFADNNKSREVSKIISRELDASGYDIEVRNFREMVKGHLDVFSS